MSLELAIQANTAAIHQLIAVMSSGKFMSADGLKDVMTVGHVGGDDEAEEPTAPTNLTASEMQSVSPPVEELQTIEPTKPLTYTDDVLPMLHKFLVAKGKPAAESLLKKYGVDKFSKVPAEQLGDLLADINKEMGVA